MVVSTNACPSWSLMAELCVEMPCESAEHGFDGIACSHRNVRGGHRRCSGSSSTNAKFYPSELHTIEPRSSNGKSLRLQAWHGIHKIL